MSLCDAAANFFDGQLFALNFLTFRDFRVFRG